jgi:hypothetical protein
MAAFDPLLRPDESVFISDAGELGPFCPQLTPNSTSLATSICVFSGEIRSLDPPTANFFVPGAERPRKAVGFCTF